MPTAQRPKVESFTVNPIPADPVTVQRKLNPEGDGWLYRAKREPNNWTFWYSRDRVEAVWKVELPPDPEIPEPRVTMPVEVYDKDGAITISDEMVMIHAYDLRVGDQLSIGPNTWDAVSYTERPTPSHPVAYRTEGYDLTRQTAPWFMIAVKIAE